ncbi:MAG TPA: HipA N-terminal domain-containing protein [Longimicrobium sp.]|jgi:serine/threonine-protein kinase HipA
MRRLEVRLGRGDEQIVVGALAEQESRVYFEYDAGFLGSALLISPFKLPLRADLLEHTERDFAAVFGVFNDSLPDGWGLLLMDREFREARIRSQSADSARPPRLHRDARDGRAHLPSSHGCRGG